MTPRKMVSIPIGEGFTSSYHKAFRYPAGEWQVRLTEEGMKSVKWATDIRITAYLRNAEQLVQVALLKSAIDSFVGEYAKVGELPQTELVLPYLPYARADRVFTDGDCFGMRVFGDIISTLGFTRVITLDVHSPVAIGCIRDCCQSTLINVSALPTIVMAIDAFAGDGKGITVLYPDKGARERYSLPEAIGNNGRLIKVQQLYCSKKRDSVTGKLTGFEVPKPNDFDWDRAIIVDDLCDGGGTFLGIADALTSHGLQLGLYVTHGIFSKGFDELKSRFSKIFTTDSFTGAHYPVDGVSTFSSWIAIQAGLSAAGVE